MTAGPIARADALARAARTRAVARIAAAVGDALPGIEVTTEGGAVVLSGRGLARRLLADPRLRWIGSLGR